MSFVSSIDSQTAVGSSQRAINHGDPDQSNEDESVDNNVEAEDDHRSLQERQQLELRPKDKSSKDSDLNIKKRRFTQQRSILKHSVDRTNDEELELLEAKKQLILRRRRLFSHYRQYEQWRRRQFSYDPCYYYRSIGQATCSDHTGLSVGGTAMRRRRQYRRQYSCADHSSREGSHESRESSWLQKYQRPIMATDITHSDPNGPAVIQTNSQQQNERTTTHFHMLQEEQQSVVIAERCTRSRINSAIFVSSEGHGFDSIEFLRRHGSQSVLCRKARSAENITDNARKKIFADREWRTDESADAKMGDSQSCAKNESLIELRECRASSEVRNGTHAPMLKTYQRCTEPSVPGAMASVTAAALTSVLGHSAAITTASSNTIIGSISIEAPPAYMKDELRPQQTSMISASNSTSHDSTDTVEELILVPADTPSIGSASGKPRVMLQQMSSAASSNNHQSPHSSPKMLTLNLKAIARPKLNLLPMVSISGPSPPHDQPTPALQLPLPPLPPSPPAAADCL